MSQEAPLRSLEARARHTGGRVMFTGAAVNLLVVGLGFFSITFIYWLDYNNQGSWPPDFQPESYLVHTFGRAHLLENLASVLLASAVFMLTAGVIGRFAGHGIQIRGKGYAWEGIRTMVLSAVLAILVLNLLFYFWTGEFYHDPDEDEPTNFMINAVIAFIEFLFVAVPGVVTGVLSGLVIRQVGKREVERERLINNQQ